VSTTVVSDSSPVCTTTPANSATTATNPTPRATRRRTTRRHFTQTLAHVHDIPVLLVPHREHAGLERRNFHRDLVGLELHERIARSDRVALFLEPAGDGRFDDRFAKRWNLDGRHKAVRLW
jgi:hypothetical protein